MVGSGDVGTFFLGTSCAAGGAGEASGAGDENFSSSPSLRSGFTSFTTGGSCATGGAWEASVTGDENFSSSPSLRSSWFSSSSSSGLLAAFSYKK